MKKIIKHFLLIKEKIQAYANNPKNEEDRASTCTNAAPAKADITPIISIPYTRSVSGRKMVT